MQKFITFQNNQLEEFPYHDWKNEKRIELSFWALSKMKPELFWTLKKQSIVQFNMHGISCNISGESFLMFLDYTNINNPDNSKILTVNAVSIWKFI